MNSAGRGQVLTLKIAEGRLPDVGRNLARLDPADIARLALPIGGIVQIAGKRMTAAKVLPAFRDLRGKQMIQIDGLTRSNAGAVIGEQVTLTAIDVPTAEKLVLVPEGAQVWRQAAGEMVSRSLLDQPLTGGDRIRISLFGSRHQEFRVAETTPPRTVIVRRGIVTRIGAPSVSGENADRISYEDIGGLGDAVQRVREMVELPLRYPELLCRSLASLSP